MILGMRTVVYSTPDLEAGKAFYAAFTGHTPYFDQPFYVGFQVAGFELGLTPDAKHGQGVGGTTFYWGTDEIEAEVTRVVALGGKLIGPITDVGDEIQVAELVDPFGNLLGLIENPHFGKPAPNSSAGG